MSDHLMTGIVSVLLAIIGVAAVALLVSRNAQTGGVLNAGAGAFSCSLATALSPVTGGGSTFVNSLLPNYSGVSGGGCGGSGSIPGVQFTISG